MAMRIDLERIDRVRFIKLGRGAEDIERRCIELGKASIGFWSSIEEFYQLAVNEDWDDYQKLVLERIESNAGYDHMSLPAKRRHATSGRNQVKDFFESDEATLWITFHGPHLYYGVLSKDSRPEIDNGLGGCTRKLSHGWSNEDINGNPLYIDKLSGNLTKVRMFKGTCCGLNDQDVVDYLKRRLNGKTPEYIQQIDNSRQQLATAVGKAIKQLQPNDFEVLVEILFSRSWKRIGKTGGSQRFVDITFEHPIDPDRTIAVQVKCKTAVHTILSYLSNPEIDRYDHFYFVYHTLSGHIKSDEIDQSNVTLIDCEKLAGLVIDSGLTHWLKEKTS